MKSLSIILVLLAALGIAYVEAGCAASASITRRMGPEATWDSGSDTYFTIFDVIVTNSGSCPLDDIAVNFVLPTNGTITSTWNLHAEHLSYLVSDYGDQLLVGTSANAGFIASFPKSQTDLSSASVMIADTVCPASCQDSSSAAPSSSSSSSESACAATATISRRMTPDATWAYDEDTYSTIFDVVVTNSGSCQIQYIGVLFDLPANGSITSSWNLQAQVYFYLVTGYQDRLPAGNSVNAGFVANFPNSVTDLSSVGVRIVDDSVECPECQQDSSSAQSSSSDASSSSSSSYVPEDGEGCHHQDTLAVESTWTDDQGRTNAVYRLTIKNTGTEPINHYVTSFAYLPGELISMWNLQSARGGYEVVGYGDSLAPGASYSGAGIIVAGATNGVANDVYGVSCVE